MLVLMVSVSERVGFNNKRKCSLKTEYFCDTSVVETIVSLSLMLSNAPYKIFSRRLLYSICNPSSLTNWQAGTSFSKMKNAIVLLNQFAIGCLDILILV